MAWAAFVCADAYLREYAHLTIILRLGIGDEKRYRLSMLALAVSASIVQLVTTKYQQSNGTCFFGIDQ